MRELAKDRLEILSSRIENIFGFKLYFELKFDLKGSSTIGQCRKLKDRHYLIRLHEPLLLHFKKSYIDDVLFHEVAHAIQMQKYKTKVKPHGKEWKKIVHILHAEDKSYQTKPPYNQFIKQNIPRKIKRIEYICNCKNSHFLTIIRDNRVRNGALYKCNVCKQVLVRKIQ